MNTVSIDWRDIEEPAWLDRAESFACGALAELGKDNWVLSLLFCGDDFIRILNRDYRGKDEATDVLSFCMGDTVEEEGRTLFLAGDIVISLPAMARNAVEFSVPEDEELRRLIVHGILHLSGLDHSDNDPTQPMLLEQERLLASIKGATIL